MQINKLILRAVTSTLLAIAGLFVFLIVMLICVYPSTMMQITADMGMDGSSIRNAKRAYVRTNELYYIRVATQTAVRINDTDEIFSCGKMMIEDDEFMAYCKQENADNKEGDIAYEQYIYGQVCVAEYKKGKMQEAVDRAFAFCDNAFPKNNALVAVLITAMTETDKATVELIKGKMEQLQTSELSEEDRFYLAKMFALTEKM